MDEGMRVKEGENTMGNYTREEVLQMAEDEPTKINTILMQTTAYSLLSFGFL